MRAMPKPVICCLLALALLPGFLAGCRSGETRAERAAREKILIIGNGTEPKTLDPHIASGVTEHHLITTLIEGLTSQHPSEETVEPAAAERWESNEGLDEWTFHLRPTGKWSNGAPVTAHDFVFAYQRILTPKLGGQYAEMLYIMKGAEAFNKGETTDPSTLGVRALDDLTLRISLVGPTPYFPLVLTHYTWFPVHPPTILKYGSIDTRASRWTHPGHYVGNGPFQLKTWNFKHLIEVERNPHYWDAANVKLNGIRFLPIDNIPAEERMFRDGQLHKTEQMPLDKIDFWRTQRPENYMQHPYLGTYFYRINTTHPHLKDSRVRRALTLAIDRESIVKNITRAGQTAAKGFTPPMGDYAGLDVLKYDPEEARRLLAEAGYADTASFPRFDIMINVSESHRILAEAIQQMWKQNLGINVGINSQDWGVYLDSQQRLEYDVCRAGWIADYTDPVVFLDMWTTGNGNNQTGWSNAEFDALIAKSRGIADTTERYKVLTQAEAILLKDMPVIPIYVYSRYYLISPMVKNWHPLLLDTHPWKYIDVEPPPSAAAAR